MTYYWQQWIIECLQYLSRRCFLGGCGHSAKSAKALFTRMCSAQGIIIFSLVCGSNLFYFFPVGFPGNICLWVGSYCNKLFPILEYAIFEKAWYPTPPHTPPPPKKKKKSLFLGICLCSAYLSVGYPGVTFFYCCIGLTYFTKCLCFSACFLCFTYLFTVGIVQYFIGERRHRKTWLKPSCN